MKIALRASRYSLEFPGLRSRNPKSGYLPTRNRSEPLALTRLAPRLPVAAYRSGLTETGTGLYDHPVPMMDHPRARRPRRGPARPDPHGL